MSEKVDAKKVLEEMSDKLVEATAYAERGLLTVETLQEEYFTSLSIADDKQLMAFYYDNARIMADIVQDYCRKTLAALKSMKASQAGEIA